MMDDSARRTTDQERSLASLFSDLWRETATLFRDEAELAKAEMSEKVSQVQTGAASLAIGGAVLYAGFLKAQSLTPKRTVESIRGHAQFAKEHVQ